MSESGAFNELAELLVKNGFTITPTIGKRPVIRKWQNQNPTNVNWAAEMVAKNRYRRHNLGIVCGRVVAIDIDVDDAAKAELFKALAFEHLGPTAFQRIGRAPRTLLLYRPADGEVIASIKIADCIDVLSGGRQFVAFGVHPDTDRPYNWIDSQHTPATASIDDLPVLTAASLLAFAKAIGEVLGRPLEGVPRPDFQTIVASAERRQRTLPGEACGGYDARIFRDPDGRVIDGREALLAKLTAAEFAKDKNISPDVLANRVWAAFIAEADLSRPRGSNPRTRWRLKDALAKATAICRRKPDLKPPRRSRRGHSASFLHAWRKPSFWTVAQRELHLTEIGRRITAPATLAVARVMIEAVDLATGFCTLPIAEIAKRAHCSTKTVKAARKALNGTGLWIAAGGVFVPCPIGELNRKQATEEKEQKWVTGTTKVPSLYHIGCPSDPACSLPSASASSGGSMPYQPDMFGAPVFDLAAERYRRGLLPPDVTMLVRAEIRARGVTQEVLATEIGISQPQLANALARRFGLSPVAARRLLSWLRLAAEPPDQAPTPNNAPGEAPRPFLALEKDNADEGVRPARLGMGR